MPQEETISDCLVADLTGLQDQEGRWDVFHEVEMDIHSGNYLEGRKEISPVRNWVSSGFLLPVRNWIGSEEGSNFKV